MMAKMFYRFDEARQVLGMTDEQLRQLTREGKLREFRDGTTIMYKADQVDQLRSEMGLGGDNVDLGPSDTAGPIGLVDSRGDTSGGSVISLADTTSKDDTAADLSLSNSGSGSGTGIALSPGTAKGGSLGGSMGGSMGGSLGGTGAGINLASSNTGSGVSVLGLDEGGNADPSAATAMGGSFGAEPNLEAMGSGSGLLDLSRERDDTSLGAPVLDELSGGSSRGGSGGAISGAPLTGGGVAAVAAARTGAMPVYVEQSDNFAGFAAGAAAIAALVAIVAIYALSSAVMQAEPTLLSFLKTGQDGPAALYPALWVFGAALVAAAIVGFVGFLVGKKR
jgi:hypothetical protein